MSSAAPTSPPRFVIDALRCRKCGADRDGLRCTQPVTNGYERGLVRARTLQIGGAPQLGGMVQLGTAPRETSAATCATQTAPCSDLCPLSLCIQGYATHIAAGEYAEALGHIMVRTALPHSVCRVCDRPCESACVRSDVDEPVAVNALKRFVMEWAAAQDEFPWTPPREPRHGREVAVVGAGPSGLSAAYDLALRGYAVTIFDAASRPGGLLRYGIPAYRLPQEALERDLERVRAVGVEFAMRSALGRDITLGGLFERGHLAIYLAFGANRSRALSLEGERDAGTPWVVPGLEFLRTAREADAPRDPGDVVVVGGGDAAVDAARSALRSGAKSVSIVCLEPRERMPALADQLAAAEAEGIKVYPRLRPIRLTEAGIVFAPVSHGGADRSADELVLCANLVVAAIGQAPALGALTDDRVRLATTDDGHIEVNPITLRTSDERVFAGGDLVLGGGFVGAHTVTSAMAHGLRAAWAIDAQLRGAEAADLRPPPRLPGPARVATAPRVAPIARRHAAELSPTTRAAAFDEVVGTLSEDDARAEAARCMVCGSCGNCRACLDLFGCPAITESEGVVSIDPALCNGCGVCASFCPNGAIVIEASS